MAVNRFVAMLVTELFRGTAYYWPAMATRQSGRNPRLFIEAHMEASGLSDEEIANRIGVSRQTVFRWRKGERRADLVKLAGALGIQPEKLFKPPGQQARPSLDEFVRDLSDERFYALFEMVKLFKKSVA